MNNIGYCPKCDRTHGILFDCTKEPAKPIDNIVGKIESRDVLMAELEKEIWNAAIEAAAKAMDDVFTEARDNDWDTGFNYCRDNFKNQIRKLFK